MGSIGSKEASAILYEEPVINTRFYKSATQQMKDLASEVYADMQQEFPILGKAVTFDFNNGGGFESIGNYIDLDGRYMKTYLQRDKDNNDNYYEIGIRGVIAHELTHTIQNRMGKANEETVASNILNSALDRYVKDNSGTSREQILNDLKKAYGLKTLDSDTTRRPMMERMAVAIQHYYVNKHYPKASSAANKQLAHVGYYVAEELRKEMR